MTRMAWMANSPRIRDMPVFPCKEMGMWVMAVFLMIAAAVTQCHVGWTMCEMRSRMSKVYHDQTFAFAMHEGENF
jgi:hypothetical protein